MHRWLIRLGFHEDAATIEKRQQLSDLLSKLQIVIEPRGYKIRGGGTLVFHPCIELEPASRKSIHAWQNVEVDDVKKEQLDGMITQANSVFDTVIAQSRAVYEHCVQYVEKKRAKTILRKARKPRR